MASIDPTHLSPEERLQLIDELWESLSDDPKSVPVTVAQRQELDRRLADLENDSALGIPWNEVIQRIRTRTR